MCLPFSVCWGECSPVHDCLVVCVRPTFRLACLYMCVCQCICASVCVCLCVYVCVWCLPLCGHLLCVYVMTVSPCVWLSVCLCVFQCIKSYVCVLVSLPMCACPMHI